MEGKKTKSQIDEKEFIKIDNSSLYLDKKTVFTFFAKANSFFDSFSIFANKITEEFQNTRKEFQYTREEFKNINAKLDFLIQGNLKNGKDKKEQTVYFLGGKNNKDKFPEDNRSHHNSKQSENVTSESLKNEEEEEGPADSIKNEEEKTINNENSKKVSTSINSQFFIYKKNLNDLNEE